MKQSRDSLHRDMHKVTKKSRRRRALKPLELRSSKNARIRVFWHTTMPVNLVEIDYELTEIFDKNRYNGQRGSCNVSVGRYNYIISSC